MKQRAFYTANKNLLGSLLVGRVVMQPALRRAFGGVYAHIDPGALALRRNPPCPVIFCATHSGWWDGHMAYMLDRKVFHHDSYLMMEERQLARYGFFRWIGVFGVDRDDARKALASLEYITGILATKPRAALWMFPQGTITHPDARPLEIFGGSAHIARRVGRCALVPVALRYDFLLEQAPYALARLGAPIVLDGPSLPSSRELTERLAASMTAESDKLHADAISHSFSGYRRILAGRSSVNRVWDDVRALVRRGLGR